MIWLENMRTVFTFFILISFLFYPFSALSYDCLVAASSNVQYVLKELKNNFEDKTGFSVGMVVGSSGRLTSQILHGAPFDIFLSADMIYPQKIYQEGLALREPKVYAHGVLVLWTFFDLDLAQGPFLLSQKNIKRIALANPKTAPYGQEAIKVLKYYQIYDTIKPKLVYAESISQVNHFVALKSVDIGMTAKSIVLSKEFKGQGAWIEIDPKAYVPIAQGVVILKSAQKHNLKAAEEFFNHLFSDEGREIFKAHGYTLP